MPPQTNDVFAFSSEDVLKGVSQQVFCRIRIPARCGRGEPSPGGDVGAVSRVPAQMWAGRAQFHNVLEILTPARLGYQEYPKCCEYPYAVSCVIASSTRFVRFGRRGTSRFG